MKAYDTYFADLCLLRAEQHKKRRNKKCITSASEYLFTFSFKNISPLPFINSFSTIQKYNMMFV